MAIDKITLALAKKYTDESVLGAGALKGKNCTIESIEQIEGGSRVTFQWTLDNGTVETDTMDVMDGEDGLGIKSVDINSSNHLIVTYDDDTTHDAGLIEGGGSGSTVVVTPTVFSGTKIAEIDVDGDTAELYAPTGGSADLPWVTPQDYGAVGDGVTDDTNAIKSMFAALYTAGGGVVYFPKGTYIVSSPIRIYSNTTVFGDKGQAIIKIIDTIASSVPMVKIGDTGGSSNNVAVNGLVFRGTETFGAAAGGVSMIDVINGTNVSITNCLFQNNMYAAIRLINNTSNVRVFSCRFEACDCGVVSLGHVAVSDVTVRNCHFTGVSSLNNFTNSNSEQVGLFTDPDAGVSYRWVVEDCVFEYKGTNVIAFNVHNAPNDDTILIKDCVARNCTFRYCLGGVLVYHSENVLLDGLFFDDTPNHGTTPFGFTPYRMIHVLRSKNVTIRNVTSDSMQVRYPFQIEYSTNVLIDGVDSYVDTQETPNNLPYANLNNTSNLIMKNFHFKPISSEVKRAKIQMTALTDSYIDLHGDAKNGSEVQLYTLNQSGLSGNTFVIDTDNTVVRNFSPVLVSEADPNTYVFTGNTPREKTAITDMNRFYVSRRWDIQIGNQSQYTASLAVTNFTLLNDGAELLLEFTSTSYTAGKTFTFAKTGNIIPIDKPFIFSNDYKVVCHFVQKNAKWVEVERTLEYYAGANVDVPVIEPMAVTTLPTASASEEGNIYLYMGATDATQQLSQGSTYKCVSDGNGGYGWIMVSINLETLAAILRNSATFDDFKAYILGT